MNSGRHELVFSKKLNLVVEHYQCMGEFSIFSNGAHLGYTGKIAYYNMEMGLHNDNATQFLSKLLGIRIMCPSGATYLSVDCYFSELAV
jgi:hypothetical protein